MNKEVYFSDEFRNKMFNEKLENIKDIISDIESNIVFLGGIVQNRMPLTEEIMEEEKHRQAETMYTIRELNEKVNKLLKSYTKDIKAEFFKLKGVNNNR